MALQGSGGMTTGDINLELGKAQGDSLATSDEDFRRLAGVNSGPIAIPSNLYGKTFVEFVERPFPWSFTANLTRKSHPAKYGGVETYFGYTTEGYEGTPENFVESEQINGNDTLIYRADVDETRPALAISSIKVQGRSSDMDAIIAPRLFNDSGELMPFVNLSGGANYWDFVGIDISAATFKVTIGSRVLTGVKFINGLSPYFDLLSPDYTSDLYSIYGPITDSTGEKVVNGINYTIELEP